MSDSYTKLFSSITASTIVSEPLATRWLWVTMLAMADGNGDVHGSVPGLARIANITLADCEAALACFLSPDPYSRTKDNDGRRIAEIDGGWRLLNHAKYRHIRSAEERREYMREYMRNRRAEGGEGKGESKPQCKHKLAESTEVTPPAPTPSPERAEAKKGRSAPVELPDSIPPEVWADWHAFRNARQGWTARARELSLGKLVKLHAEGHDPRAVVEQSIERGWTGLFPVRIERNPRGPPAQTGATSKYGQAIETLERMKRGHQPTDPFAHAASALPRIGRHASG